MTEAVPANTLYLWLCTSWLIQIGETGSFANVFESLLAAESALPRAAFTDGQPEQNR